MGDLKKELKKCSGIFDYEDLFVDYALKGDIQSQRKIIEFINDNPKKKDILGHALQSLSQEDYTPLDSVKLILDNDVDEWQLEVALRNLSNNTSRTEMKIKTNALKIIKYILEENPFLTGDSETFIKCCFKGSHQVVSCFLDFGAENIINEINDSKTPLLEAIRSKDLKKVKVLVERGADINLKKDYVKKPLEYAEENKCSKIAEYLKSVGAKKTSDNEMTVYEMINSDRTDLLEKVVKEGKDKDIPNGLSYAVNHRKTDCAVVMMKDENYEYNPKDLSGALYYACQDLKGNERVFIAKMLIERGADINAEIHYTPLIEKLRECSDIMDLIKNSSVLKELENSETEIEELTSDFTELLLTKINSEKKKTLPVSVDVIESSIEEDINSWDSTLGGKPYLTSDMEYPLLKSGEPMPFFGQINFEEIPKGLFENQPEKGLLQIYIDEVYSSEEKFIFIKDIKKDNSSQKEPPEFKPLLKNRYKLNMSKKLTFTNPYPKDIRYFELYKNAAAIILDDIDKKQQRKVEENVFETISEQDNNAGHHMGGYVYFTQEDPRYGDKKDYINLIQIDELDGDGDSFFWGDGGLGHVFVKPEAFKTLDFSDSIFHFDCY